METLVRPLALGTFWLLPHRLEDKSDHKHFSYRFWFFAARNNPETAPLTVWIQGQVGLLSITQSVDAECCDFPGGGLRYAWSFPGNRTVPHQQRRKKRLSEPLLLE